MRRGAGVSSLLIMLTALVAVTGGAGLTLGIAPAAAGPTLGSYTITARADVLAVQVVDPNVPLFPNGEITYATPGTAQAVVDSLGESTAFASSPYPGDAIAGLPSLFNGLIGSSGLSLPAYPFVVTSSYPGTPNAQLGLGPYALVATSGSDTSTADARTGVVTSAAAAIASLRASASSTYAPGTGKMTAVADGEVDGISIGSLLSIGRIAGHAQLTDTPGGTAVPSTSFSVGTIRIAGITVGFTDSGFTLGSTAVPGLSPALLTQLLAAAGITLKYLPAVTTPTQVDSAGLSVSFGADVPNQGRVTTTLILGRVRVGTPYNLAAPTPSVNLPSSSSGAPPTASPVTALPAPVSAPVVASPPPAPTAGAVAAPPVQPSAVVHPLLSHGTIRVYAAMVIGAAALVLAALLMRRRRRDSRTATSVLRLPQS